MKRNAVICRWDGILNNCLLVRLTALKIESVSFSMHTIWHGNKRYSTTFCFGCLVWYDHISINKRRSEENTAINILKRTLSDGMTWLALLSLVLLDEVEPRLLQVAFRRYKMYTPILNAYIVFWFLDWSTPDFRLVLPFKTRWKILQSGNGFPLPSTRIWIDSIRFCWYKDVFVRMPRKRGIEACHWSVTYYMLVIQVPSLAN